jgi:hypothetical protein
MLRRELPYFQSFTMRCNPDFRGSTWGWDGEMPKNTEAQQEAIVKCLHASLRRNFGNFGIHVAVICDPSI